MMRKKINEVIVVEGRHDTERLRKYFDCDTIETGGTHLGKEVLSRIAEAQKTRGVIVFTDPDSPGNRIRHQINQNIPNCKNAYVQKAEARTSRKVGVEHAAEAVLREALEHVITYRAEEPAELTVQDMTELGLTGDGSTERREYIGKYFHVGFGNAKTMRRRLNFAGITRNRLQEILKEWQKEK